MDSYPIVCISLSVPELNYTVLCSLITMCIYVCLVAKSYLTLCNLPHGLQPPSPYSPPLSMGFSKQEYWSGLLFPLQSNFATQGSNQHLLYLLHCQQVLYHLAIWEALNHNGFIVSLIIWKYKFSNQAFLSKNHGFFSALCSSL